MIQFFRSSGISGWKDLLRKMSHHLGSAHYGSRTALHGKENQDAQGTYHYHNLILLKDNFRYVNRKLK